MNFKKTISMIAFLLIIFMAAGGGYAYGFIKGLDYSGTEFSLFKINLKNPFTRFISITHPNPTPLIIEKPVYPTNIPRPTWTGPELWEEVNARRREVGVGELQKKEEICTIASIRLNELLELGKLDNHEGFTSLPSRRPELNNIYEKYSLTEFLLSGASSPQEAVSLWENTLGHSKLLKGGEYVWGCIYAQYGFAVAITAY